MSEQEPTKQVDINDPTIQDFKKLGAAGYLMVLWAFMPMVNAFLLGRYRGPVAEYLKSHGEWGPWVYAAGFALTSGCGMLPTWASATMGGWAFGFERGLPAALVGFTVASLIGRAIAKPTAKDKVEKLIAEKPKWKAVRDALIGGSPMKTLAIVTLLRVPPNSPFAITNFLLSSTRVPFWSYLLGTILGMTPRTAAMVYIGSTFQPTDGVAAPERPVWYTAAGIAAAIIVLFVLWYIGDKALQKLTKQEAGQAGG